MRCVISVITLLAVGHCWGWTVRPGLQQSYVSRWHDWENVTSGLDDFGDSEFPLEIVPGPVMANTGWSWTNPHTGHEFAWTYEPDDKKYAYRGEVHLDAGINYTFGKRFDDGGLIRIGNITVIESRYSNEYRVGGIRVAKNGWYPVYMMVYDAMGGKGPAGGGSWNYLGLGWNTIGVTGMFAEGWRSLVGDTGEDALRFRFVDMADDRVRIENVERTETGYRFTLSLRDCGVGSVWVALEPLPVMVLPDDPERSWGNFKVLNFSEPNQALSVEVDWRGEGSPFVTFIARGSDMASADFRSVGGPFSMDWFFGRAMRIDGDKLRFAAVSPSVTNTLYMAYGNVDYGDDPDYWPSLDRVGDIPGELTEFARPMPDGWGLTSLVVRYFLEGKGFADSSEPVFSGNVRIAGVPVVTKSRMGKFLLNFSLAGGCGAITAVYNNRWHEVIAGGMKGPCDRCVPVMELERDCTYAYAVNAVGGEVNETVSGPDCFYNGVLSLVANGSSFTVSRRDTRHDLAVNLTYGGTARAGVDYGMPPATVTIPDGETSVTVPIVPIDGPNRYIPRNVEVRFDYGLYEVPTRNAPMAEIVFDSTGKVAGDGYYRYFNIMASGYAGTETLKDFPMPVRISEEGIEGFRYADMKCAEGGDLKFFDEQGNALDYDIDTWNTNGESVVWVSVPELRSNTIVRCAYSNSRPDFTPDSTKVWSRAGYVGVWHMNGEKGDDDCLDSSGNGLTAVATNACRDGTVSTGIMRTETGIVGMARNSGHPQVVPQGNYLRTPAYGQLLEKDAEGRESFTVSGWFRLNSAEYVGTARLLSRKSVYIENTGWELEFDGVASRLFLRGADVGGGRKYEIPVITEDWTHIGVTAEGRELGFYVDGDSFGGGNMGGVVDSVFGMGIGCNAVGEEIAFAGGYDEVRVRNRRSSFDWLKAERDSVYETFTVNGGVHKTSGNGLMIFRR